MPDRRVLVTGCSSGFGRLMVPEFLAAGWRVAAGLRNAADRADIFRAEREAHGDRLLVLELDVTRPGDRAAARETLEETWGGLDCLVNNAGFGVFGPLEGLTDDDLRAQIETNVLGLAGTTRELLPLLRRSRGRVINVSSVLGYCAIPLTSAYVTSKWAVEGLSESLWHELRPHGVQVALVEPGAFRTDFGDKTRWASASGAGPEAYAAAMRHYRGLRERFGDRGADPRVVSRAVARLATRRRMPLRTRLGTDARLAWLVRRLLPSFAWNRFTAWLCDRLQRPS